MRTAELAQLESTGQRSYASLFSKAHTLIWDIDRDLDWSIEVAPDDPLIAPTALWCHQAPTWQALAPEQHAVVAREDTLRTVRLLSIGESVAQVVCAKQTLVFDREDWRNHASAQALDEARHHVVYERFLEKCGGTEYYVSEGLERMFDMAIDAEDATTLTLREQLILESVGFGLFKRLAVHAANPLLKRIFELVIRDESRHMAFGLHYIKAHVATLDPDARTEFAREALDYINMFTRTNRPTLADDLAKAGVADPVGIRARIIEEMQEVQTLRGMEIVAGQREPDWGDPFIKLFLNLKYVGLLDDAIVDALGDTYEYLRQYATLVNRKTAPAIDADNPLAA